MRGKFKILECKMSDTKFLLAVIMLLVAGLPMAFAGSGETQPAAHMISHTNLTPGDNLSDGCPTDLGYTARVDGYLWTTLPDNPEGVPQDIIDQYCRVFVDGGDLHYAVTEVTEDAIRNNNSDGTDQVVATNVPIYNRALIGQSNDALQIQARVITSWRYTYYFALPEQQN